MPLLRGTRMLFSELVLCIAALFQEHATVSRTLLQITSGCMVPLYVECHIFLCNCQFGSFCLSFCHIFLFVNSAAWKANQDKNAAAESAALASFEACFLKPVQKWDHKHLRGQRFYVQVRKEPDAADPVPSRQVVWSFNLFSDEPIAKYCRLKIHRNLAELKRKAMEQGMYLCVHLSVFVYSSITRIRPYKGDVVESEPEDEKAITTGLATICDGIIDEISDNNS